MLNVQIESNQIFLVDKIQRTSFFMCLDARILHKLYKKTDFNFLFDYLLALIFSLKQKIIKNESSQAYHRLKVLYATNKMYISVMQMF